MADRTRGRRIDRRRLLDLLFGRLAALGGIVLVLTILSVFALIIWVIHPLVISPAILFDDWTGAEFRSMAVEVEARDVEAGQDTYRGDTPDTAEGVERAYSLLPLIFGTLKGALYTLLFAVPLSVLAALYASQFMPRGLRERLKPLVEIMAAVPSVVLGFIGGIWLAPFLENHVIALFLAPLLISGVVAAAFMIRHYAPAWFQPRHRPGMEIWILSAAVLAGGWMAFECGAMLEARYLQDGTRFIDVLGLDFAQRNSIVVGMVMGLAVTPIIFTISEDAMSAVPSSYTAGSLSLGATRWQTAVRIVLPTAGAGILSAVMLGFSKAIGETMIILFVSGNVPAMDWSVFTGFRALSAGIAFGLPDAGQGGSLYQVMFFAAFLLLIATFTINTLAELIRRRFRRPLMRRASAPSSL